MSDYISIISSLVIFLFPYIGRKWFNIQLLSSTVVSLGLLGTFGGIMYGLWLFNVDHIDLSIPQLLEGLKTAFLTSIAGMLASLLLKLTPAFYGMKKEVEQQEEFTDKQLFELLGNIEKNTKSTDSSELIQVIKLSNERLVDNFQSLNDNLLKITSRELSLNTEALTETLQMVISHLDNKVSEQINQTILKIHDIQEQQLQYMAHAEEFTQTMQEQLRDTLLKLKETNKNIETFLGKTNNMNMKQSHAFMEQVSSFGDFIKGSEQQMNSQLTRIEEKYERELTELEKFTKTLMTIVKKLSIDHDTLYKKMNDSE
ncbi:MULTISPECIES: hypothetical protein [Butyricimonas]|uniref:hypothetical protein n=1 Tax=Butyricimonas TaxID=574697 RepID=UPI001D0892D3|nr:MULTISPECIES: hypothetical protein [Butyricimonas]MCB6972380.1 hypothetical protein [Butyricimonas synergistica]MCG4519388.1 hypothetical protein [Butyricimonas sp. DFI.6.44]